MRFSRRPVKNDQIVVFIIRTPQNDRRISRGIPSPMMGEGQDEGESPG
jgi:hypothetical protein